MNRRDFIKSLAGIPLLGFLKLEEKTMDYSPSLDYIQAGKNIFKGITEGLEASGRDLLEATKPVIEAMAEQKLVRWNGAGDSWESNDGGETWTQTGFRVDPDGVLYISGNFLEEDIEQVRQRHYDYYRLKHNGESFSTLK